MPETILIVEDEPALRDTLTYNLKKDNFTVEAVGDGRAALESARALKPDLIILDIMMPIMDGYTLNSRLQKEEKTRSIPILVLTAKGQKMRDLFEMAPNVAAYVQKPFDPKMLRELILGILSSRKN